MQICFKRFIVACLLICCFLITNQARASEIDGTINNSSGAGYAWSDMAGWINFGLPAGNIHVTDSGLSGYAWSANTSWISLNPSNGGVQNNDGQLSGSAWGTGLGWINFSGVSIDNAGKFHGQATGTLVGTLTFDCSSCDVRTDWRPIAGRSITPPTGGGGGGGGGGTGGGGGSGGNSIPPLIPGNPPAQLSPGQIKGIDTNNDRILGIIDFNIMMVEWGNKKIVKKADMNKDGLVDFLDLSILMAYWGLSYQA